MVPRRKAIVLKTNKRANHMAVFVNMISCVRCHVGEETRVRWIFIQRNFERYSENNREMRRNAFMPEKEAFKR